MGRIGKRTKRKERLHIDKRMTSRVHWRITGCIVIGKMILRQGK